MFADVVGSEEERGHQIDTSSGTFGVKQKRSSVMAVVRASGFLCLLALQAYVLDLKVVRENPSAVGVALLLFVVCLFAASRKLVHATGLSWLTRSAILGHASGFLAIMLATELGRGRAINSLIHTIAELGWPALLAVAFYPLVTWSWLAGILFVAARRSFARQSNATCA